MLQALEAEYSLCERCPDLAQPRGRDRRHVVMGAGSVDAKVVVVGEAPGKVEDEEGTPFRQEAPSGQLLDSLLRTVGRDRSQIWITNVALCWPTEPDESTKSRKPSAREMKGCRSRLYREIEVVDPYVLLLLGDTAKAALCMEHRTVTSLAMDPSHPRVTVTVAGQCRTVDRWGIVTFHPSYLLQSNKVADMSEGGALHRTVEAFAKAFLIADTYAEIYR